MIEQDAQILKNIQQTLTQDPNANQRTLAQNSNVSLGQMNAVLKRCMERGWIAVKNLNMKKVCYYLTSEGMEEVRVRSSRYMKNTFSLMNEYADKMQNVLQQAKEEGKTKVILVEESNIDFLIEYTCEKLNLEYEKLKQFELDCARINMDCVLFIRGEFFSGENTLKGVRCVSLLEVL